MFRLITLFSFYAGFALADTLISDAFSSTIAGSLHSNNVTGLQVAVVRNGSTQLKAWGNKTETGEPLTPHTLMNIGSASKAFLATAMGILIDDFERKKNVTMLPEGVDTFTWTTKVKALLPEWKLVDKWATEKVNIQDLLSHVTGVASHSFSYASSDSVFDVTSRLQYLEPIYELREQYDYNNQMYIVGAYIIEKYSNVSFASFVEERIMKPTGMTQSTYSPSTAEKSGNLSQSFSGNNRRIRQWITDESAPMIAGPGGVLSSAADMLKWVQVLLNKGTDPSSNTTVFPLSVYNAMTKSRTIAASDLPPITYGFGWNIYTYEGHDIIFHAGGIRGGSAFVVFLPADGIAVVVLVNGSDRFDIMGAVWTGILDELLGVKRTNPNETLTKSLVKRDSDVASTLRLTATPQKRYAVPSSGTFSLESFTGTYHNPGYGAGFTLCTAYSTSSICKGTISDFASVDGAENFNSTAAVSLYASWPRFCASHLRFIALNESSFEEVEGGGMFTFEATNLFPDGYGLDMSAFEELAARSTAQFGIDEHSGTFGVRVFGGLPNGVLFQRM